MLIMTDDIPYAMFRQEWQAVTAHLGSGEGQ